MHRLINRIRLLFGPLYLVRVSCPDGEEEIVVAAKDAPTATRRCRLNGTEVEEVYRVYRA